MKKMKEGKNIENRTPSDKKLIEGPLDVVDEVSKSTLLYFTGIMSKPHLTPEFTLRANKPFIKS